MNRPMHITVALLVASTFSLPRPTSAQPDFQSRATRESAWLSEKWTGDEAKWRLLRQSSEREFVLSRNRGQLLQRLKTESQRQPQDARAQFRWAYAIYRAAVDGSVPAERAVPLAADALSTVTSPRTYEFARLRFLLEAKKFPSRRLRGLGLRLAKRDPNDYSVKYRVVKILDPGLSPEEKNLALQYANDLVRLAPQRPSAHAALGGVYYVSWAVKHAREDGQKSIAAYTKYLQLAPPNDPFRPRAQQIIAMIRKRQGS